MSKRILVVDDEANIRDLYEQEFTDEGYAVDTVGSAEEASDLLAARRPDLMILDIELPGQDGLAYLREVMEAALTPLDERHAAIAALLPAATAAALAAAAGFGWRAGAGLRALFGKGAL